MTIDYNVLREFILRDDGFFALSLYLLNYNLGRSSVQASVKDKEFLIEQLSGGARFLSLEHIIVLLWVFVKVQCMDLVEGVPIANLWCFPQGPDIWTRQVGNGSRPPFHLFCDEVGRRYGSSLAPSYLEDFVEIPVAANVTDIIPNSTDVIANLTDVTDVIANSTANITANATDVIANATDVSANATDVTANATDVIANITNATGTINETDVIDIDANANDFPLVPQTFIDSFLRAPSTAPKECFYLSGDIIIGDLANVTNFVGTNHYLLQNLNRRGFQVFQSTGRVDRDLGLKELFGEPLVSFTLKSNLKRSKTLFYVFKKGKEEYKRPRFDILDDYSEDFAKYYSDPTFQSACGFVDIRNLTAVKQFEITNIHQVFCTDLGQFNFMENLTFPVILNPTTRPPTPTPSASPSPSPSPWDFPFDDFDPRPRRYENGTLIRDPIPLESTPSFQFYVAVGLSVLAIKRASLSCRRISLSRRGPKVPRDPDCTCALPLIARAQCIRERGIRGGGYEDRVLNAMLTNGTTRPQTFSIVTNVKDYLPWTYETLSDAAILGNLNAEQVSGILFQIVWTLSALQNKFPDFNIYRLGSQIRLYKLYKARYFINNSRYYMIPANVPLPIIANLLTLNLEKPDMGSSIQSDDMIKSVCDVFVNDEPAYDVSRSLRKMSGFSFDSIVDSDLFNFKVDRVPDNVSIAEIT